MKYKWINYKNNKKLIIFFNGWGMDENVVKHFSPEDYDVFWGFEDQKLFEYAKMEIQRLSSMNQPFNFTMLTVDTHFTDGYKCEKCESNFEKQYANVIHCSDRQIYEFVRWIQEQDFYENTTIVLIGDHLSMAKEFCTPINQDGYYRTCFNLFINPPKELCDIDESRLSALASR